MSEQYRYQPSLDDPMSFNPPDPKDWKKGGKYFNPLTGWAIDKNKEEGGHYVWDEMGYQNALKEYEEGNKKLDDQYRGIDPSGDPRVQATRQITAYNKAARDERTGNQQQSSNPSNPSLDYLKQSQAFQSAESEKEFRRSQEMIKLIQEENRKNNLTPDQQIDIVNRTQPLAIERIRANNEGQIESTRIASEADKYGSFLNYKGQLDSNSKQLEGAKYQADTQLKGQLDSNTKQLEGTKYRTDAELTGSALSTMVQGYTNSMTNSVNRLSNIFSLRPDTNMTWKGLRG